MGAHSFVDGAMAERGMVEPAPVEAAAPKAGGRERRLRICLISPAHLSTNPRLVKEARALSAAGHSVHVIHGQYTAAGRREDMRIGEDLTEVTAVPFGPTEARRGTYVRQTLGRQGAQALFRAGFGGPGVAARAHAPVVGDLASAAMGVKADLYVAHYVAALPAAARAAHAHGALYAFDAEDFHLGDLPDVPEHGLEKQIIRSIEACYLPGAAYVTAASPGIADAYRDTYGIGRPAVVLNLFPRARATAAPAGTVVPGPSLYWFSQTIGAGRGLETAVEALALARSRPHLYLRGTPAAGYEAQLMALAAGYGVGERIHLLPVVSPADLESEGARFDLGYVGEVSRTTNRQIALTNKLFSYLSSGLPIVASDIAAHRPLATEFGAALSLFAEEDAAALAGAVDRLAGDPSRLAVARQRAWTLGQGRYSWEAECQTLVTCVEEAVARHSRH